MNIAHSYVILAERFGEKRRSWMRQFQAAVVSDIWSSRLKPTIWPLIENVREDVLALGGRTRNR